MIFIFNKKISHLGNSGTIYLIFYFLWISIFFFCLEFHFVPYKLWKISEKKKEETVKSVIYWMTGKTMF